ncbi:MAG: mercuric reductase [Gammaproteobacteria bacterium]|nr:mercuric reductase [Gammaproteobacteria bacterium]
MSADRVVILPDDVHNRELVSHVHPSDWRNPEPRDRYHLVVVGAGTGGLVSAAIGAGLGAKVAMVERHLMGGDCLNFGCVPSKAVISSARRVHAASAASANGRPKSRAGPGAGHGSASEFTAAMARMRRLRARISPVDGASRFAGLGVDVFLGHGEFVGPDRLRVNGDELHFRRAVIATGARAALLPVPGLEGPNVYTNETIFSLTELPPRVIVIGAGPIGVELSQTFARFGSEVTVVHADPHPLPRDDRDAAAIVTRAIEADGVRVLNSAAVLEARREDGATVLAVEHGGHQEELAAEAVLVAAGRAPNVDGMGLKAAGVAYDRTGIRVDDQLRTTAKGIYAVGDVASKHQFTHAADHQARIAVQNALFFGRGRASRLVIPWATYTDPEVAHVGLHRDEAIAARHDVETITIHFDDIDRAILEGEEDGFFRVHLKKGSDRILGATLVCAQAGDMIGEVTLAMTAGLGLGKLGSTIHPYPTRSDVFARAANAWRKQKLTPTAQKVFRAFFRVFK